MRRIFATVLTLPVVLTLAVCGGTTNQASAQNQIDGTWLGTYTSTHSSKPTAEVLIFKAVSEEVVGTYLSVSQSAGTLIGQEHDGHYVFQVTQPIDGCPPASGTLSATIANGILQYRFVARSCKGTDIGNGTAQKLATGADAFPDIKTATGVPVSGLWNGVYTSTHSRNPTSETIFLYNFGDVTKGIYVSDSGVVGILTGQTAVNPFYLAVSDPSPPCPGSGVFKGEVKGSIMQYDFHAMNCQNKFDVGQGQANRAQ